MYDMLSLSIIIYHYYGATYDPSLLPSSRVARRSSTRGERSRVDTTICWRANCADNTSCQRVKIGVANEARYAPSPRSFVILTPMTTSPLSRNNLLRLVQIAQTQHSSPHPNPPTEV